MQISFTKSDIDFTRKWWSLLLKDETRMNKWLQKLQVTELAGYYDNLEAIVKFRRDINSNARIQELLLRTATDEKNHSNMLVDILADRGVPIYSDIDADENKSLFWSELEASIVDIRTMASVYYLGEELAAFRFEIIYDNPNTPSDIRGFIEKALPDEKYHARGYLMHTSDEALASVISQYDLVVKKLKGFA